MGIEEDWFEFAETDGQYAIAYAILSLSRAIDRLGNGNAATPMGAIEGHAVLVGNKIDALTAAIWALGEKS